MSLGERLREIRQSLPGKVNQTDFANMYPGVTRNQIKTYELDLVVPSDLFLSSVCDRTGYRFEWLKNGEEPKYQEDLPDSPGALAADLAAIFAQYPAISAVAQRVIPVMTPDDLAQLNALLDRIMGTKKEAPED